VCVCVCVYERERERERESGPSFGRPEDMVVLSGPRHFSSNCTIMLEMYCLRFVLFGFIFSLLFVMGKRSEGFLMRLSPSAWDEIGF
jgi:hypothetical protein